MKKILTLIAVNVLMVTTTTSMIVNLNSNIATNTKTFINNKGFSVDGNSEIVLIGSQTGNGAYEKYYELIFTPETFEIMVNIYHGYHWGSIPNLSTAEYFKNFIVDMFYGVDVDKSDPYFVQQVIYLWNYGITSNLREMISKYTNSSRNQRWDISFTAFLNWKGIYSEFKGFNSVLNDTKYYPNEKLERLNAHFNGDLTDNGTVNLGIIPDSDSETIKHSLKKIYPKLYTDELEIVKIESRSTSEGFLFKLRVKEESRLYSIGDIQNNFIFNTEINLKRINDKIANDSNVKMWIRDINDWNQRIKREIKEDVPNLDDAQKRIWKDNVAEQMKSYMRDWNIIIKLIDVEIKLEDLDNAIKDIKKDIQTLKEQIADINQKIADINNKENSECDYYAYSGVASSLIPGFGIIISTTLEAFWVLCEVLSE